MMTSLPTRQIIHLDMDAFYASAEVLDNPDLAGKPVIVGGSSNRGVVSAASYAAREFGVHSAMPIMRARKLCPIGIFLPVRMARYQELSLKIMSIFQRFTPLVEPISLDEAFLDVTASTRLMGSAVEIANEIRVLVKGETGLTVSAGVAANKLLAKIASDFDKPDGLTVVEAGKEREFLAPLEIKRLWGVGKAARQILSLLGVKTIGDICSLPLALLKAKFGEKHGEHLYLVSQGIDEREVQPHREIKSIGHEDTFSHDLVKLTKIRQELLNLTTRVGKRLRLRNLTGKTVTVKVKYNDFTQVTRSETLSAPTADDKLIYSTGCRLLEKTEAGRRPLRLLGITLSNLQEGESGTQLDLFSPAKQSNKRKDLYQALDTISNRFGDSAIVPGKLLDEDE